MTRIIVGARLYLLSALIISGKGEKIVQQKEKFPILLFSVYAVYFAGQAVQNAYQSLFLTQNGFSPSQIGTVTAVTTIVILLAQTLFGYISDQSEIKNRMICLLYIGAFAAALLLFTARDAGLILAGLALFGGFFSPLVPLTDDVSTSLVGQNRKYDYGTVRMGGTIGYAVMMLVSGYLLNDNYRVIFLILAVSLFIGFFLFLSVPKVSGQKKKKKQGNMRGAIFGNRIFLFLIFFNLLLSVGETLYSSYYPIYYLTIGGNSRMIGVMQFVCAISEVPCLFVIGRIVRKIGTGKTLAASAAVACLRWLLLYLTANPVASIWIGLLHGLTFASTNYCLVNYISRHVEEGAQASSQVFKSTVSMIFSRAIFGYIGGVLYEACGPRSLLLLSSAVVGAAAVIMLFWSKNRERSLQI